MPATGSGRPSADPVQVAAGRRRVGVMLCSGSAAVRATPFSAATAAGVVTMTPPGDQCGRPSSHHDRARRGGRAGGESRIRHARRPGADRRRRRRRSPGGGAGRSPTWPSPRSMTRHTPSVRRARSTVTNGGRSAATSGSTADRSGRPAGVVRGVRVRPDEAAHPADPPGADSAERERSKRRSTKPPVKSSSRSSWNRGRHRPRSGRRRRGRGVHGLVPVVLHRFRVVAQDRRARAERRGRAVERVPAVAGGPRSSVG